MQVASEYLKYYPNQGNCSAKLLIGEGGLTLLYYPCLNNH